MHNDNPFDFENFSDSIVNLNNYSARRYKNKLDRKSEKYKTLAHDSIRDVHWLLNLNFMSNYSNQPTTLNDRSRLRSIYKL